MILRKTLLVASAVALMSTPAWALPSQTPSNRGTKHAPSTTPVGPPDTTPNNTENPGSANRSSHSGQGDKGSKDTNGSNPGDKGKPSNPGKSHKCTQHKVAYVASGTLESWTLTKNADGTYSGEVVVAVTHTNHNAKGDNAKTTKYPVAKVHVTFGGISPEALAKGDRVKLIGKITALAKKCDQSKFTPETTIRKIVFHAPSK
jgi:hypothetical protein